MTAADFAKLPPAPPIPVVDQIPPEVAKFMAFQRSQYLNDRSQYSSDSLKRTDRMFGIQGEKQ